eukprot:TRINITY_DN73891_c0_g1_i1.p1 TRINITY_DN73891_c0_g1~~TRINITY_DN73891_c0_g1_i1.p1  ORF type:complete len:956 (+),score=159.45 TRINITY_DN73891_c0_g1_i1:71-2938(+)
MNAVQQRLSRLINGYSNTEELTHVTAAELHSEIADEAEPYRKAVWLAIGRTKGQPHFVIFVFTRARLRFLQPWLDSLYCVIPIVANIRLEVNDWEKSVSISWKHQRFARPSRTELPRQQQTPPADLMLAEVDDSDGMLRELEFLYKKACVDRLVFHSEQKLNHNQVWAYRDFLPLDLAKLSPALDSCSVKANQNTAGNVKLLCMTWNVGATSPLPEESLEPLLDEEPAADICCIGLQETCALTARRVAFELAFDGTEWTSWRDWVVDAISEAYEGELELMENGVSHLVGMLVLVFVRKTFRHLVTEVCPTSLSCGFGGVGGNKGAVAVRFALSSTSFCFVNAHLAAGQEHYIARCQHYGTIMKNMQFGDDELSEGQEAADAGVSHQEMYSRSMTDPLKDSFGARSSASELDMVRKKSTVPNRPETFSNGDRTAQGSTVSRKSFSVSDHDHVIWLGDANSRLHWHGKLGGMPIQTAKQKVQEHRFGELLALDQLNLMRRDGMAFQDFDEKSIKFVPSYKWLPDSNAYNMRSQKHVPAWTDRILYRSKTSPAMTVHKYNIHLGLRQSDHRPVFATLTACCDQLVESCRGPRREERSEAAKNSSLCMEPDEVSFKETKPDFAMQRTVKLRLQSDCTSQRRWRYEVFLKTPSGKLSSFATDLSTAAGNSVHDSAQEDGSLPLLARWLRVNPSKGVLRASRPTDLNISLCVAETVLQPDVHELQLVVKLGDGESSRHFPLPVQAVLEPSVMRAPLHALAELGRRPLLGSGEVEAPAMPLPARLSKLPPKEALSVMQWVLLQSRDMAPGSLEWWPDPLSESLSRTRRELRELQRYVEHGWPLPKDGPQLDIRSAILFLLKWLSVLPEPLLPGSMRGGRELDDPNEILSSMDELSHAVLLTVVAFFAQLQDRHGQIHELVARLAGCFTQKVPASQGVMDLITQLVTHMHHETSFPPHEVLAG